MLLEHVLVRVKIKELYHDFINLMEQYDYPCEKLLKNNYPA